MKKLVFTALAVMAFSGVSIAETKEVEEKQIQSIAIVDNEATPCQNAAIDAYERYIALYRNGVDDIDLLNSMMSICAL